MTIPLAASWLVLALSPAGKVRELSLTVASDRPGRTRVGILTISNTERVCEFEVCCRSLSG
ncbi:hypothetical protein [Streptomyces sp. NPDC056160]|uniref:hypothetical protein n=1 Tax=Streptomyces sp. NPDC056160 TaxID=3345731 RepID=UPI0035D78CDE